MQFEWQQVSLTLMLSYQYPANYNDSVDWISLCHLISRSSSPFTNHLGIVLSALTTIDITVSLMFQLFFYFSNEVFVLIFLSSFFYFHSMFCRDGKVLYSTDLFLFVWLLLGLVMWSTFVFQNPKEACVCVILQEGFCVVCIQHVRIVKFRFFCTTPSELPFPPSHVKSYTLFTLIYCILLLYDWSFRLFHPKAYIYLVVSIFALT